MLRAAGCAGPRQHLCGRLCLLMLFSAFLPSEQLVLLKACFSLWGHSVNTQPSSGSTGLCEELCFVRVWKGQALTRTEGEGSWVRSIFRACFFLCTGRGLSDPPVPCCRSLAIFTHRDGLKRVKIMLGRKGEFIEILCLVCHGTGVFKVFLGLSLRTAA